MTSLRNTLATEPVLPEREGRFLWLESLSLRCFFLHRDVSIDASQSRNYFAPTRIFFFVGRLAFALPAMS